MKNKYFSPNETIEQIKEKNLYLKMELDNIKNKFNQTLNEINKSIKEFKPINENQENNIKNIEKIIENNNQLNIDSNNNNLKEVDNKEVEPPKKKKGFLSGLFGNKK